MRRDIFTEEHEMFRAQVRRFVETEIVPKIDGWNRAGMSDRESWRKLGAAGFLAPNAPAEYGGGGVDFIYDAIVIEEMARVRAHGLMMGLHSDICIPYLVRFRQRGAEAAMGSGSDQRRRDHGYRDDRAGDRLRSRRRANHRPARRRQLRHQRLQDFHLQWPDRRPLRRGREDRPQSQPAPSRRQPHPGRSRCARVHRGRKLDKLGFQAARTPASCSSRIAACRSPTFWAARATGSRC